MFEHAAVGRVETDLATGRLLKVNAKYCEITGYSAKELYALTYDDLTHPDDIGVGKEFREEMLARTRSELNVEKRLIRKDGRVIWVSIHAVLEEGEPPRTNGILEDITARRRAEWFERDRGDILEMVLRHVPMEDVLARLATTLDRQLNDARTALFVLDDGGMRVISAGSPSVWRNALRMQSVGLAYRLAHLCEEGQTCAVSSPELDECWGELRAIAVDQHIKTCWTTPIPATDGTAQGLLAVFFPEQRTPTEPERALLETSAKLAAICVEHQRETGDLARQVRHDPLTGLANRLLLEDRLEHALELAERNGKNVALIAIDIDFFKGINDTMGHDAGDELLQAFACRLMSRVRKTDTLARVGGDEFLLVLPDLSSKNQAEAAAQKIVDSIRPSFDVAGEKVRVSVSMGIAMSPANGIHGSDLRKRADEALYIVKERGRDGFEFAGA